MADKLRVIRTSTPFYNEEKVASRKVRIIMDLDEERYVGEWSEETASMGDLVKTVEDLYDAKTGSLLLEDGSVVVFGRDTVQRARFIIETEED